jgi:hypothetical protein
MAPPAETIPQIVNRIDREQDPRKLTYLNVLRAEKMGELLRVNGEEMPPPERMEWAFKWGSELLNAGKTEEALKVFATLAADLKGVQGPEAREMARKVLFAQALGGLRLGEQQNCCANNNADSCLVPITRSGIHTRQQGSRAAISRLTALLKASPNDTGARWLLNIAYMTIGKYPKDVPAKWLVPESLLGGEYPMAPFRNAAPKLGLASEGWAGSVAMEDFDGDGFLDLLVSSMRIGEPLVFYHNDGNNRFTQSTKEAGLEGETGGLNLITTDYNNDGRPDVVVLRGAWFEAQGHYPLSLLRNDGDGRFTNVTLSAGLLDLGPTQTAVAFDYNSDGWLDLFVGHESTPGDDVPCRLFRNDGDGTFTDVTELCGLDIRRYVKAVVSADYLHTGRPGLYISCRGGKNLLLRNDGPAARSGGPKGAWKFTEVARQAGVDKQNSSFSGFFFDQDNDGWLDLYVCGYGGTRSVADVARDYLGMPTEAEKAKLYRNNRDGTFTDISKQARLNRVIFGMGLNFGDLDNDGWLDFYAGTGSPDLGMLIPNRMFRSHEGKYFQEVTTSGGFGHLQKGHGIAFGDLNNNGNQDVFQVMGGALEGDTANTCLYVNPGNTNRWVTLQLTGVKSNRVAIGAEVCLTVKTPSGRRKIYRTVGPGGSFGNNPLRLEIGLGKATAIESATVDWPATGTKQEVQGLSLDGFYRIREGDSQAERFSLPSFKFP